MYLLQDFLRNGGTLNELHARYAIDATRHKTYPNLVLLKYNQLESPFAEKIVQEARGLILDEADNWRAVCVRFNKFFNWAEAHAAQIDWNTARVQEKLDGSLMTIYYYDNKWHVASSGSPDASGQVHGWDFTFADLFWKTFNEMGLSVPNMTELCLSFELTSPFNRVVIPHKESKLTLIGIHLKDGDNVFECPLEHDNGDINPPGAYLHPAYGYPIVKSYSFSCLDEVVAFAKTLNGVEQEGFVVVDGNYNRVKIKGEQYVNLHHLKDSWGPRRVVEVVRTGEISEVINYFPEFADQFNDTKARYDKLVKELNDIYQELKDIPIQKDFALAVQARNVAVPSALYQLRAGRINSVKQHLADMPVQSLMKVMGLKEDIEKS